MPYNGKIHNVDNPATTQNKLGEIPYLFESNARRASYQISPRKTSKLLRCNAVSTPSFLALFDEYALFD